MICRKREVYLLMVVFFGLLSEQIFSKEKQHSVYVGLKIELDSQQVKSLKEVILYPTITDDNILFELNNRFSEMVAQYSMNKTALPSCIYRAMDCFLEKLKTGEYSLRLRFEIVGITTMKELHEQRKPKAECPGVNDYPNSKPFIRLYNFFKKFHYVPRMGNLITSASIFHEFFHYINYRYQDCISYYDGPGMSKYYSFNEAATEDGTWSVFGKEHSNHWYESILKWPVWLPDDTRAVSISNNDCLFKWFCQDCEVCKTCEDYAKYDLFKQKY